MSLHRSLAHGDALVRHRNVLTRGERIARLEEEGRWKEGDSILGLPKVRNIKILVKKKKVKAEEAVEGAALPADGAAAPETLAPDAAAKDGAQKTPKAPKS